MKQVLTAMLWGALCAFTANAVTYMWNGNGGDSNWTTAANWDRNSGYPVNADDNAYVSAAASLHLDVAGNVTISKLLFSPEPSGNLTVTGAASAGLGVSYFTVGGTSVLAITPDIALPGTCIKDGSGTLGVSGNLTAENWFYINNGTLRIAGGNADFKKQVNVGNGTFNYPARLCLTDGGTMRWNSTVYKGGPDPLIQLSGGTLHVAAGGNCLVPMLVDGTNLIDTTALLFLTAGLSIAPQGHLIKSGAGGINIASGTTNFVAGDLTISNSYIQFSMNSRYESYGGSSEPWRVRVCNGGRFFVGGPTAIFTVPLDLVMEPGGTVEFPSDYGANYNVVVAHSIVTNGVSLAPGRYKGGSGIVKAGGLGSVVLATRWTGAGDGVSWFDADNWNGAVPDGQNAVADLSPAQGPVSLGDQVVTLTCLVYNPQGAQRALTLTGSGTLNLYAPAACDACLAVGPGRALTLDVNVARAGGGSIPFGIFGNGTVIVKKNFPSGDPGVSLMGDLVFDGTTAVTGDAFMPMLGMVTSIRPVTGAISNDVNASVAFASNCLMSVSRIFNSPYRATPAFYPAGQIIHDGAEITLESAGYVFLTRYADTYLPPFAYFMRAGKLSVPANSGSGISLGCTYTSAWEAYRRGGAAFVMTGGEVTTPRFQLGTPEETLALSGGEVYLGAGGIVSTTNGFQGRVNLGGVTIHAAANWGSLLNLDLTGEGGLTVLDSGGGTVTLSGALSGPGGLSKTGTGTLTLNGANLFTGTVSVAEGTLSAANGLVNATNLSVTAAGAVLVIGSADSLNTNATLRVGSGGLVNLNFTGMATVNELIVDGEAKTPGIYGSGKSFLTGAGVLSVRNGPPPKGTLISFR
ncbi:MAG: autotransporter-associated beta strand repeat-containing protein [Kiritimatiellia bacterium]|jgi:autotransporter-associated beta strand protein|nr:autotransporter-associated beta strand repeat-containing protein [Kiritimatiellia bacterium]